VERHNEKHPSEAVFAGDRSLFLSPPFTWQDSGYFETFLLSRIVDVNGKTEDGDMIYELTVGEAGKGCFKKQQSCPNSEST
jgi:hypothetical protein